MLESLNIETQIAHTSVTWQQHGFENGADRRANWNGAGLVRTGTAAESRQYGLGTVSGIQTVVAAGEK